LKDLPLSLRLLRELHATLMEGVRRPAARDLIEPLFLNPYVNASRAASVLGVSNPTARAAISDLVDHGILREITGRKWGRLFLATEILDAAQGSHEVD